MPETTNAEVGFVCLLESLSQRFFFHLSREPNPQEDESHLDVMSNLHKGSKSNQIQITKFELTYGEARKFFSLVRSLDGSECA